MKRLIALFWLSAIAAPAFAEEAAPEDPVRLQSRIAGLVLRLGADDWSKREKATEELVAVGAPALDALKKAAQSDDPEVRLRAQSAISKIEASLAPLVPPRAVRPAEPRENVPFPVPAPWNRDFAELVKRLMRNPFDPRDPRFEGFERDFDERMRRMIEGMGERENDLDRREKDMDERFQRMLEGGMVEQRSVFSADGKTVEVSRSPDSKVTVKIRSRDETGNEVEDIYEAGSVEEFAAKHPDIWEKYAKNALSRARVVVFPGPRDNDDVMRMFDEEMERLRGRGGFDDLRKQIERMMRGARAEEGKQDRADVVNRITISQDGREIRLESKADGSVTLTLRERDEDGRLVQKQYAASSMEEFALKHPDIHEKYVKGRIAIGGARQRPALPQEPPRNQPPEQGIRLGIVQQQVSEVLRVHLGIPEGVGFVVREIEPGSSAERAGLVKFDLVLEADSEPVGSTLDVLSRLSSAGKVHLLVVRGGRKITLTIER